MESVVSFLLLLSALTGAPLPPTNTVDEVTAPAPIIDNLELGEPGPSDQVINRQGYALGYSTWLVQPYWVTYRLTRDEVVTKVIDRTNDFTTDTNILSVASTPEDYWRSGYDRGHLAPAADMNWSTNAMHESFLMSNMSPQKPFLNREVWNRAEKFTRTCAEKEESVFVVSGPIATNLTPRIVGRSKVVVPDAFYKVIYDETPPAKMMAFVMPNDSLLQRNMWLYATNVVYVEKLTGLNFFPSLPTNDVERLKSTFDIEEWRKLEN